MCKGLHCTLWLVQGLHTLFFFMVGDSHGLLPYDQIAQQATWMDQVPHAFARFIGGVAAVDEARERAGALAALGSRCDLIWAAAAQRFLLDGRAGSQACKHPRWFAPS
jgi:hypothetical protein